MFRIRHKQILLKINGGSSGNKNEMLTMYKNNKG